MRIHDANQSDHWSVTYG